MKPLSAPQAWLMRTAASLVSPGRGRGTLLVLIYHRVLAAHDPLLPDEPDAATFAAQMDLLARLFNVIPFGEAMERLASGSLPPRAVAITFDDGYANNLEVAAPILRARGLAATFFVTTGFIDGGQMWNDLAIEAVRHAPFDFDLESLGLGRYAFAGTAERRKAVDELLPKLKYLEPAERLSKVQEVAARAGVPARTRLMMTESQLRELAACGMEIGAHCVTHPILARVPAETARREIVESKSRLESVLGSRVRSFAYPNGRPGKDYTREHVAMVRDAGFSAAVSTAWGAAAHGTDLYQVPRVAPWDRSAVKYGLRMVRGFTERNAATV
jgi:peptidoglycan/xylan/chitin deacetylase (PgdA/CDA1 family)